METTMTAPDTTVTSGAFQQKLGELCGALVERPDFAELRRKVDAFMADESAKFQYQMLSERGSTLQMKQNSGMPITPEELGQFEALREGVLASTVATEFMDAQQEIGRIQDQILQHVHKTLELGRAPTKEDFDSCCSSSCGCH